MYEGKEMYKLAQEIFPIYRSITGIGVEKTYICIQKFLGENCTLNIHKLPTGTKAFDWKIPKEWKINEAYIEDELGEKIIDFKRNCLHVMGYSIPVDKWVTLDELKKYIYTQPDQPEVIPYVTSYYKERFGFCMSENQKKSLLPGKYHMYIDSDLFDGSLLYADTILPGNSKEEIIFSTYSCHPSMANDNCSGLVLLSEIIKYVNAMERRHYTYRFIIVPETIGAIAYLSDHNRYIYLKEHFKAGYTLCCVGDNREYSIVHSQTVNSLSDRAITNVLRNNYGARPYKEYSFLERGSDERQYNSPMIGLSVVGFCRSKYWEFPEYHTSQDDLELISEEGFQGSFDIIKSVIDALECNNVYKTIVPCEPQLGKRGLYPNISQKGNARAVATITDFIAYADGKRDLIEISDIIHKPISELIPVIEKLLEEKIIVPEERK